MAETKRYYWLRLHDDFFSSVRIKKLRRMAGGDTYVIIYLKMQLKAIKTDGVLTYKGYEQDFVEELALDLDEEPDNVRITLAYLVSCGLAETEDNVNFFLPYAVDNTGSETASTQRWREWKNKKVLDSNTTPTLPQHSPTTPQQNANVEIEKEIEKDTRDRDKSNKGAERTPLDDALDEFVKHRKALKRPLAGKGIELIRAELEKLAPGDEEKQIAIINQSIMRGWQGVFPLKADEKKGPAIKSSYDNLPPKKADGDDLERLTLMLGVDDG